MGDPGDGETRKDDLTVGLIRDQVDGVAILPAFTGEDTGQLLQGLFGVDYTGGIIGLFTTTPLVWGVMTRSKAEKSI